MNYHKDNGLLNMIRRTDPMIIYIFFSLSLLTVTLLPAVGLTLPCCRPDSREQNAVLPVR